MISAKELRIGDLVKDKAGNIWRVGCVTGMRNESKSLILEREVYSGEDDVMPIEINDNILDTIYFKRDKGRDVYRGYGISIEIFDDGYYLSLRDLEDDLGDPIQIKNLHHLQNLLMDLYGHDIKIDKLYGDTGE